VPYLIYEKIYLVVTYPSCSFGRSANKNRGVSVKIKVPGILILVSAFFYLFATITREFNGWGIGAISTIIALLSIALLVVGGLLASNKNLFLVLIGAYLAMNLIDGLFFDWYQQGLLVAILGTFLPVNLLLGVQSNTELILDIHLIILLTGFIMNLVSTTSRTNSHSIAPTYQAPLTQRPVVRASVGIEGDAIVQVQKLGELLKQGLISQDEFDTKKKQILGL